MLNSLQSEYKSTLFLNSLIGGVFSQIQPKVVVPIREFQVVEVGFVFDRTSIDFIIFIQL
jgi:hypothetical protein